MPIPCATVDIAVPRELMIGGAPDKAVLIPVPIPFAAVDMAVPADLTILPKPLKIWLMIPPLLREPFAA